MEMLWKVDELTPNSLARAAESLVLLGFCKEPAFEWMASAVSSKVNECRPDEISALAWAFASAGQHCPALADCLAAEVAKQGSRMPADAFGRAAWGLSRLGSSHHGAFQPLYWPTLGPGEYS